MPFCSSWGCSSAPPWKESARRRCLPHRAHRARRASAPGAYRGTHLWHLGSWWRRPLHTEACTAGRSIGISQKRKIGWPDPIGLFGPSAAPGRPTRRSTRGPKTVPGWAVRTLRKAHLAAPWPRLPMHGRNANRSVFMALAAVELRPNGCLLCMLRRGRFAIRAVNAGFGRPLTVALYVSQSIPACMRCGPK